MPYYFKTKYLEKAPVSLNILSPTRKKVLHVFHFVNLEKSIFLLGFDFVNYLKFDFSWEFNLGNSTQIPENRKISIHYNLLFSSYSGW